VKPSTQGCVGEETLTSANNGTPVTANIPKGTSAVQVTVETTSCRMSTTSTGDPTSGSSGARILQKDQMPWFMPIGQGTTIKFASTAGTQSVIQIAYLT
jgi:hypothetical protein